MGDMKANNTKLKNYQEHKQHFAELVNSGASEEDQSKAFGNMFDALSNDLREEISAEVHNRVVDNGILAKRAQEPLTSEERKFFNAINTEVGYKEEKLLPEFKLTCFVVVPDDLTIFGPNWIERFVRTQIQEAIAVGLESAVINGGGSAQLQPVGLTKDINTDNGAVTDKSSKGTLTFKDAATTVQELKNLLKDLSTDVKNRPLKIDGKVVLVVNPQDAWDIQAQYTYLTANGGFVTVLPYNVQVVSSEFVTKGKLVAFVSDRYDAVRGGSLNIKKFDQTLALEDCILFTAKTFAYGQPADNKASAVYDLNITTGGTTATTTSTPSA